MPDKLPLPKDPATKLEQWNTSPMAAQWLVGILESDMGRFLIEVLEERHPVKLNRSIPASDHMLKGIALSAAMTGYEQCLQNIRDLRDPVAAKARNTPKPNYGVTEQNATE